MARRLPTFLRGDEPERLLAAASCERDRVLLAVGLYAGLRVSEIARLTVPDIDLDDCTLFVRAGKGDKDRYVAVSARLVPLLRDWIGTRRTGLLFPSPRGGRLTNRAIEYLVDRTARRAGIQRSIHPHTLRHTFATRLLSRGANLREVQVLLGHSSVAVTEIYAHVDTSSLKPAVDRL